MQHVSIDFERLAKFNYAIINAVAEDGFPFSLPTDFEVTPKKEILLRKPAPSHDLFGKEVGVLFNHISAIPTGGYTDRRYMLVWGKLTEQGGKLRLEPRGVSAWDEKILPFGELCAKSAPQGAKYLRKLGQIEA